MYIIYILYIHVFLPEVSPFLFILQEHLVPRGADAALGFGLLSDSPPVFSDRVYFGVRLIANNNSDDDVHPRKTPLHTRTARAQLPAAHRRRHSRPPNVPCLC